MNLLSPFGLIYKAITGIRNALYDRGWISSHAIGARTISVGNLTAGGTGKTPVVALVAKILADAGESVCILTRGYGREEPGKRVLVSDKQNILANSREAGDEPLELARQLLGKAIVIADADRVAAAKWAINEFGPTAFVLDDGFQHRQVKRDLDIVCIDATDPWGGGIIPAGKLRESKTGLNRADIVLLTRSDLVDSTDAIIAEIRKHNPAIPVFDTINRIRSVTKLENFLADISASGEASQNLPPVYAFCALGNPESFRKLIDLNTFQMAGFRTFRDHYRYSQTDIDEIVEDATAAGARALLTTAKDAVKLKELDIRIPVYVVEIEVGISDRKSFDRLVTGS